MQLLDEHLWKLFVDGLISPEEATDKARNAGELQDKIDAYQRGQQLRDQDIKDDDDDDILRTS